MGHVTYMILLSLPMEYLGPYLGRPSMTTPPSHVFGKIRIFAKKHCKLIRKNGRVPGVAGVPKRWKKIFSSQIYNNLETLYMPHKSRFLTLKFQKISITRGRKFFFRTGF